MRRMLRMTTEATIYVIDDDDAVRQSLEFVLKSAVFSVRGFESAQAFLDVLPTVEHGCIVTDVRMPEITGIELLKKVKQTRPELPVIVITGHGDISLAVEAMKIGAVDFLEKPFAAAHLLGAVRSALDREADLARLKAEVGDVQVFLVVLFFCVRLV